MSGISLAEAADSFLSLKRIAVAGVSSVQQDAANGIYKALRERGYETYPLNPKVSIVEGDKCYPDLKSLPVKPEGVVIVTRPEVTLQIVKECAALGINHVWMHKSFGDSVSQEAVEFGRKAGMTVIPGGCPMMFIENADFGHKCMKSILSLFGRIPKQI
ncbi:MAG: CoA-binding protein [Ignavibacteriaceae bacterium]|nr:CoA-binding protein [Ignavibacteriaceae bacterium]